MQKNKSVKFQAKILFNNGEVTHYFSKRKRRILSKVKGAKISEVKKYYLKVNYGLVETNFGEMVEAINEGVYENLTNFQIAWKAFNEGI